MTDFHFLRPWWLVTILVELWLFWSLWRQSPHLEAWAEICDSHLLKHLMQSKGQGKRPIALFFFFLSALALSLSLAGPTWSRLPVPSYRQIQPRVVVLDLSVSMLANDLKPDRLTRAKFKLHDLFKRRIGQFGLIAYTSEPFVVAPLTDDAQTIDALLSSLSPDIMPVEGQKLESALEEAAKLIANSGFSEGQILVMTGETPSLASIGRAKSLAGKHIYSSIMPMLATTSSNLFADFARAGRGQLIPFAENSDDLDQWLSNSGNKGKFATNSDNAIPVWRDEGRWFLIPALLFLLPVFRRGWLQGISS